MEKYLQVKDYEIRVDRDIDKKKFYILSFGKSNHVKVSERAMKIISLMDGTRTFDDILEELSKKEVGINRDQLKYFITNFIEPKCLLEGDKEYINEKNSTKLWIHIPVIEASTFAFLYKIFMHLINKYVSILLLGVVGICCISAGYILVQTNENVLDYINSLQILCLVYLSMFIHELGHATAAYKYGVNVGKIGFGLHMTYLIFFVDMTNIWRLDKTKRIVNDVCGMYFQLITIIPVFIFGVISNNPSLFIVVLIIMLSSLMNIIPVLRMDGYWLLTDYLNLQNVQIKAKQSITKLYYEIKKKYVLKKENRTYTIAKSTYFYGVYSIIYSSVTALFIIIVLYASLTLIINWRDLVEKMVGIYRNLMNGNLEAMLVLLNNVFILLIPLITILGLLISGVRNVYKRKRKEPMNA